MSRPFPSSRAWLREPLLHFLVIGVALFLLFTWLGDAGGPGSSRITVTSARVQQLAAGFARTWQRPPTESELKGLIDEFVREEIAYREATAMGLDRDDTVIRRRLRQKLEFLVEDAATAAPPTEGELQAWLDEHPEAFMLEPRFAFRQVYLDPSRPGDAAARTGQLLELLRAGGPEADISGLGDALMLAQDYPLIRQSEVARLFGDRFAAQIPDLEPGRWSGPVSSGYGQHLVLVLDTEAGRVPALEEVRAQVERELLSDRRRRQLAALYEELLRRYSVTIEAAEARSPESPAK